MRIERIIQLEPGEEVLEVIHQSLLPYVPKLLFLFVWFTAPFFFLFSFWKMGLPGQIIFFSLVGSAAFFSWRLYWIWSRTCLIITDRRIVDIDQYAVFGREVSEIPLASVEDISYQVRGVIPTIFRYGSIQIFSDTERSYYVFEAVRRPVRIHDLLHDLRSVVLETVAEVDEIPENEHTQQVHW